MSHRYTVNGLGWTVEGDFFAHDYEIRSDHGQVAVISKKWFTWGDTYQISTYDNCNHIDVLAVVLIIDACMAAAQSSAN